MVGSGSGSGSDSDGSSDVAGRSQDFLARRGGTTPSAWMTLPASAVETGYGADVHDLLCVDVSLVPDIDGAVADNRAANVGNKRDGVEVGPPAPVTWPSLSNPPRPAASSTANENSSEVGIEPVIRAMGSPRPPGSSRLTRWQSGDARTPARRPQSTPSQRAAVPGMEHGRVMRSKQDRCNAMARVVSTQRTDPLQARAGDGGFTDAAGPRTCTTAVADVVLPLDAAAREPDPPSYPAMLRTVDASPGCGSPTDRRGGTADVDDMLSLSSLSPGLRLAAGDLGRSYDHGHSHTTPSLFNRQERSVVATVGGMRQSTRTGLSRRVETPFARRPSSPHPAGGIVASCGRGSAHSSGDSGDSGENGGGGGGGSGDRAAHFVRQRAVWASRQPGGTGASSGCISVKSELSQPGDDDDSDTDAEIANAGDDGGDGSCPVVPSQELSCTACLLPVEPSESVERLECCEQLIHLKCLHTCMGSRKIRQNW